MTSFGELPTLSLTVTFRALEDQKLPPFLGSALHGSLARSLYRTVCAFPRRQTCEGCPLEKRCAYPALFRPPRVESDELRQRGVTDQSPRALVLAPERGWTRPSGNPVLLREGDLLPFRITLIGRGREELPYLVVALQRAATRGLGLSLRAPSVAPERAPMRLERIRTPTGCDVYRAADEKFHPPPDDEQMPVSGFAGDDVEIELVTPLRLKEEGRLATRVSPFGFFRTLGRRVNTLSLLFGSGRPMVNEEWIGERAARVTELESSTRLAHVRRYSSSQKQRMTWPGLLGRFRWTGEGLGDLWPILQLGEVVQVGKGTALGFGRYAVREVARVQTRLEPVSS